MMKFNAAKIREAVRVFKFTPVEIVVTIAELVVLLMLGQYLFDKGVEAGTNRMRTENEIQAYYEGYDAGQSNRMPEIGPYLKGKTNIIWKY